MGIAPSRAGAWSAPGLCMRGWQVGELLRSSRRLVSCLARRNGSQAELPWNEALAELSESLGTLSSQDPSAVGVLVGPELYNEEAFAAQALARGVLGLKQLDSLTGVTDAAALWGLQYAAAEPYCGAPLDQLGTADVILCLNSNLPHLHPRAASTIARAVHDGTEMLLLDEVDQGLGTWASTYARHTPGARAAALRCLCDIPTAAAEPDEEEAGWPLPREVARDLLRRLEASRRLAIVFSLAAVGSADAAAMIGQLAVELGAGGSRWVGVYALPAGANAFGVADMLAAGQDRAGYGRLSAAEMLSPASPLRGLLVIGDDLARWVGSRALAELREQLETLIAVSAFPSPTTELADIVLPLATVGEREGSMRTADGRVWWNEAVVQPPGEARPLCEILDLVSAQLGQPTDWANLEALWQELHERAPGYAGIDPAQLRRGTPGEIGPRVLSQDAGTAHLSAAPPAALGTDEERPFVMLTRHDRSSWALDPRCQGAHLLRREARPAQEPYCLLSADDLRELKLRSGQPVRLATTQGAADLPARASLGVPSKVVVLPAEFAELARALLGPGEVDDRHGGVERAPVRASVEAAATT